MSELEIRNIFTALLDRNNIRAITIKRFELAVRSAVTELLSREATRAERRTIVQLLKKANFGCAVLEYNGFSEKFVSFSSMDDQEDWHLLEPVVHTVMVNWNLCTINEAGQRFATLMVDDQGNIGTVNAFDRNRDTESKILEAVASCLDSIGYTEEVHGTLYLYTDRRPCLSCTAVINEFLSEFSSIQLTILHGGEQE